MYNNVFSEFEVQEMSIKFDGEDTFSAMNCVGSSSEELEVKIITKNCRGRKEREKVRPTGAGTLTLSLHVPLDTYRKMYDMSADTNLKDGVYAYGRLNMHPEFALVQKVMDEDDVVKFKAYPRCILESGISRKIENGAEEVAELELTVSILPDEYGNGMYEALEDDIQDADAQKWMTEFDSATVHKA